MVLSLALSDLGLHFFCMLYIVYTFPTVNQALPLSFKRPYCQSAFFFFRGFRLISVLQELHLAVTFTAQCFRATQAIAALEWGIAGAWGLGSVLAILNAILIPWVPDDDESYCVPENNTLPSIDVAVLVTAATVCCGAYLVALWFAARRAPGTVQRKVFNRTALFPLNFLVTYMLIIVAYTQDWVGTEFYKWAMLLEFLNGFSNTFTYWYTSRYAKQHEVLARVADEDSAFLGVMSFCLMFDRGPDVVIMPKSGREALWQSEMETRTIENQRRPDEINPASLEMPPGIAASKSWEGPPSGLAGIEDASPRSWG
mmetsp:Transcript_2359/g.5660  ORF Transcript_2359/g.5660 Transcript_2359/m.5660 type:complete len:313 (+) Transcript_2359:1-939(+)